MDAMEVKPRFGVWLPGRRRWARLYGSRALLLCGTLEEAEASADMLMERFPEERFMASGMPPALDWGPQWSDQQVANRKAFWAQRKKLESPAVDSYVGKEEVGV